MPIEYGPLGLRVPGEMNLNPFGEKAFAAALAATGQGGASRFGAHAGAKTVLLFARALGGLESSFHKISRVRAMKSR